MAPAASNAQGQAPSVTPNASFRHTTAMRQGQRSSVSSIGSAKSVASKYSTNGNSISEWGATISSRLDSILDEEAGFRVSPVQMSDYSSNQTTPTLSGSHSDIPSPLLQTSGSSPTKFDTQTYFPHVPQGNDHTTTPRHSPPLHAEAATLKGFDAVTRAFGQTLQAVPEDSNPDRLSATTVQLTTEFPSPPARPKARGPRLSVVTAQTDEPKTDTSGKKPAPEMVHWKQVREHVMVPTPVSERPSELAGKPKKKGLVSKAAGRFGLRLAAESAMGYDQRRGSTFGAFKAMGAGMTQEEKEEASRQRRRFGREIKKCLDACSAEESRRRLKRLSQASGNREPVSVPSSVKSPFSMHYSTHGHADTKKNIHPPPSVSTSATEELSAFAPLLTELHGHLPDARAKRIWSLTCPHHSAILAELGSTFLPDSSNTDGDRAQALEVFGTLVRNWQSDNADEELDRWLWLCRAMIVSDRALRDRGFKLLHSMLRQDGSLPTSLERPQSAPEFESLALALFSLLHALEDATYLSTQHQEIVLSLINDLKAGVIIKIQHTSLSEWMGDQEMPDTTHGVEEEMLWMAAARAISTNHNLAGWLLDRQAAVLKQFAPPPPLPGMPELLRRLRMVTIQHFLLAFLGLTEEPQEYDILLAIMGLSQVMYQDSEGLPGAQKATIIYTTLLLRLRLQSSGSTSVAEPAVNDDLILNSHARLTDMLRTGGSVVADEVAMKLVASETTANAASIIQQLFQNDLTDLARRCVPHLLTTLEAGSADLSTASFFTWLSSAQPQLFYKPLFSCAAATQASSLTQPLSIVRKLIELVGPRAFWMQADPQMLAIVLTGEAGPRKAKGKGKEGAANVISIRLGRYAVLLELLMAIKQITKPDVHEQELITTLESRVGFLLEAEEKDGSLPEGYRSLICQLLSSCRLLSRTVKKNAATRLALTWLTSTRRHTPSSATSLDAAHLQTLSVMYNGNGYSKDQAIEALRLGWHESLSVLLVAVQASITSDEWGGLLHAVWERYGRPGQPIEQATFLLMKCIEADRGGLRDLVANELTNAGPEVRQRTLLKLALLYGYRFSVLSQPTVTDKRGQGFKFGHKTLDFVMTDIGSISWVPTQDAQDAALQKYGRSLPLELRQRLMDLGWTEDDEMTASDFERVPVTVLAPSAVVQEAGPTATSPTDVEKRDRRLSNTSTTSQSTKVHRAVIPPDLLALVMDQARLLSGSVDVNVNTLSWELVRMIEREDAALFIRSVAENYSSDPTTALARLNGVLAQPTPAFAYTVLNSLAGFLKMSVRADPTYPHWAAVLSTVARVVPFVSAMSLRSIRKSKAENVLLPASIYEEDGGLKIHLPWQTNAIDVQTAQLTVLASLLQANSRDVYLIKKMLFNLQVQESMRHLSFARAWLELIIIQFSAVNGNYNDRAELRHYLFNINTALALHGTGDLVVASLALRALMLCAARFRRVFASIGFVDVMRTLYITYVHGHAAIKDAVEYACRSFYRIHQDVFVYQMCLALADDPFDSRAAYGLVACLSAGDLPQSGVPSGIRGLNDKQEIDALLQMISGGAQVSLAELGKRVTGLEEQQDTPSISLEPVQFPRQNIVKLLVTVIAANAASARAIKLMDLFAVFIPLIRDEKSRDLLEDAVDVLGRFVYKRKAQEDATLHRLLPGDDGGAPADWEAAARSYVRVVDHYAQGGGRLNVNATRRFLDTVGAALLSPTDDVGTTASSALGAMARTELAGKQAITFLKDLSAAYKQHMSVVDFSQVLDSITSMIQRKAYNLPDGLSRIIIVDYVEPAIRMLALASEESMAFIVPMRKAAVELLGAAVFLQSSDAFEVLEKVETSPGLLAGVILPLTLVLERPDGDRDEQYNALWVRLLRIVIRPTQSRTLAPIAQAATAALSLQVLKIITIRAPDAISDVCGLWPYISAEMLCMISSGNGKFFTKKTNPRVVDWMMWTLFEMLALHRSPLHIDMRLRIQTTLADIVQESHSRPTSMSSERSGNSQQNPFLSAPERTFSGMARRPSARMPSFSSNRSAITYSTARTTLSAIPDPSPEPLAPSQASSKLEPDTSTLSKGPTTPGPDTSRNSRLLTPLSASNAVRPSFSALSARRASRPHFDAFTETAARPRFPSSVPRPGDRGAIVHLLGPATVAAATGAGSATVHLGEIQTDSLTEPIQSSELSEATHNAVRSVLGVYGYPIDSTPKIWSLPDALHEITEQSRLLIEQEFAQVFNPPIVEQHKSQNRTSWFSAISGGSKRSSVGDERRSSISASSDGGERLGYTLNHTFDDSPLRAKEPTSPVSRYSSRSASPTHPHRQSAHSLAHVPLLSVSHA